MLSAIKPLFFGIRLNDLTQEERAYVCQGKPAPDVYVPLLLAGAGPGEPGLSVRKPHLGESKQEIWVVYRDPDGKPVSAALLKPETDKKGTKWKVEGLVTDRSQGLLSGRAVMAVIKKLEEMGVTEAMSTTTVSPEARLLEVRLRRKKRKADPPAEIPKIIIASGPYSARTIAQA